MNKTPIEAAHAVFETEWETGTTEHKVVFYIDGQKYGFRCDEATLDTIKVAEGTIIPFVKEF